MTSIYRIKITYSLFVLTMVTIAGSCSKEPVNPFDRPKDPDEMPVDSTSIDSTSIAGLHAHIFAPTCANSGCHDGTFEPDFRTINSTYNTLVYQSIIKNDPEEQFMYRVVPGQADQSVLLARMKYDIDGNSGVMPLVTEPDSDYPQNKERYIQQVEEWINSGAKDIYGNSPTLADGLPQMQGVVAFGDDWLSRVDDLGTLKIPHTMEQIDLYFSITDDLVNPEQISYNKIKFSNSKNEFDTEPAQDLALLPTPISQSGYWGVQTDYYHTIRFRPSDYGNVGDQIYFRIYVKDSGNPITEIPANGGSDDIKSYFSFTIE